jgi:hypothetical protein
VTDLKGRKQYRPEFIQEEVNKMQAEARAAVASYMQRFDPLAPFSSPVLEDGYWTTSAFLNRAVITQDPILISGSEGRNTTEIMKALLSQQRQTNLLLQLPRLSTATLGKMAEAAHSNGDWALLSQIHSEAEFRAPTDERAMMLKNGIDSTPIVEVQEGAELAARANQLKDWVGYSLRSLESGEEDLGVKYEAAQGIADERRLVREQERTHVRERREGAFVNGADAEPAA